MDRIIGANTVDIGGGRRGFRSKDTVGGVPGTVVTATHLNAEQEEIMAVIEKSGLAPSAADLQQLLKAIRSQRVNYVLAASVGGTANAITLTLDPAPTSLADLVGTPIRFIAPVPNSGPTGIVINGLASRPVIRADTAGAMKGGEIVGMVEVIYDGVSLRLQTSSSDSTVRDALFPQMTVLNASSFTSTTGIETAYSFTGAVPTGDPRITAGFALGTALFTVPAGMGGLWYCQAYANTLTSGATPSNGHGMRLKRNGVIVNASSSPAAVLVHTSTSFLLPLADGDTCQMFNFPNNASVAMSYYYMSLVRFGRTS